MKRQVPKVPSPEDLEIAKVLAPFMRAGLNGLERSTWKPSQWRTVEELVAPIVVAVLVEVAKQLPLAEMTAALYPDEPVSRWPLEEGIDGG